MIDLNIAAAFALALTSVCGQDLPIPDPDSRIITDPTDQQHEANVARLCLAAAMVPGGPVEPIRQYAARHRLTSAEGLRLLQDCSLSYAVAIQVKLEGSRK